MLNGNIVKIISDYIEELKLNKKLSSASLSAYSTDLKKFFNFLNDKYDINEMNDINKSVIISYTLNLKEAGRASSSISRSFSVIKNFLLYCFFENIIDVNLSDIKLNLPKEKKQLPEILTIEEINTLLSLPKNSVLGYRDKAMLEVLYTSGLKVNELIELKITDLNLKLKVLKCSSKNSNRILPLGVIAQSAIENYLEFSRNKLTEKNSDYLFVSYNGKKMSRQGFWKIVKKYGELAGIKKNISTSTFRHSFASHMIQNGISKEVLKNTLGNTSIASVQVYLDLNRKRKTL